jgi:hypothetical protein
MLVELTKDELCIINKALNEVCNGIDLEGEFDTRMGCTVEEEQAVLAKIHGLATSHDQFGESDTLLLSQVRAQRIGSGSPSGSVPSRLGSQAVCQIVDIHGSAATTGTRTAGFCFANSSSWLLSFSCLPTSLPVQTCERKHEPL